MAAGSNGGGLAKIKVALTKAVDDSKPLYSITVDVGGSAWTVYRREEDFHKVGLKSWLDKASSRGEVQEKCEENEALIFFLNPETHPPAYGLPHAVKKGWLLDKSHGSHKRWAVLANGYLYLYPNEKSSAPVLVVDLAQYCIDLLPEKEAEATKLVFVNICDPKVRIALEANALIETMNWIAKLRMCRDRLEVSKDEDSFRRVTKLIRAASSEQDFNVEQEAHQRLLEFAKFEPTKKKLDPLAEQSESSSPPVSPRNSYEGDDSDERIEEVKRHVRVESLREAMHVSSRIKTTKGDNGGNKPTSPRITVVSPRTAVANSVKSPRPAKSQTMREGNDVQWGPDQKLRAVRLEKLIDIISEPHRTRTALFLFTSSRAAGVYLEKDELTHEVILTYFGFTTSENFFNLLSQKWRNLKVMHDPMNNADLVRTRIKTVLIQWIENHFDQFAASEQLSSKLLDFIGESVSDNTMSNADANWIRNIVKYQSGLTENNFTSILPDPILPSIYQPYVGFLDVDSLELARQFTLIQFDLFSSIPISQYHGQKWNKSDSTLVPQLRKAIARFNDVSNWAAQHVLQFQHCEQRAANLTKLIDVAFDCLRLNNFETVVQILSGIEMAPLSRLKLSWSLVPDKSLDKLVQLRNLFDPNENWKVYRAALANASLPCLPYLGLYLQAFTFSEDGNDTFTKEGLINWNKITIIRGVIEELLKYRKKPFALREVREVKEIVRLNSVVIRTEKELYLTSLEVEPRDALDKAQKVINARKEAFKQRRVLQKQQREEERRIEKIQKEAEKLKLKDKKK